MIFGEWLCIFSIRFCDFCDFVVVQGSRDKRGDIAGGNSFFGVCLCLCGGVTYESKWGPVGWFERNVAILQF